MLIGTLFRRISEPELTAKTWCSGYQTMWNPLSLVQYGRGVLRFPRYRDRKRVTLAVLKYAGRLYPTYLRMCVSSHKFVGNP